MTENTDDRVWVINTITVQPGKAQIVADLQVELVDEVKKDWPGFISQHTLIALDGSHVATVEAWADFATLKAIVEDERLLEYRARIAEHATLAPVPYKVVGDTTAAE
ncbi:antibiotic biosynthesis monooxygenase [Streptomyces sp. NPDC093085]|uniref:antibiotic biosynthesis monooxygenase n=1 Tax=Streptomyces sp. NPDC093085 TaxID=3155068 RepID=UPI00342C60A4